jgi:hypothetical protein
MVKSTKSHLDEEDEAEDYDSSSYKGDVHNLFFIVFNFVDN